MVVNASNREKIVDWLNQHAASTGVTIVDDTPVLPKSVIRLKFLGMLLSWKWKTMAKDLSARHSKWRYSPGHRISGHA
jgi:hypothetical protein